MFYQKKMSKFQKILREFVTIEMHFHAKALELYTQCFQTLDQIDPEADLEVSFVFFCVFGFFLKLIVLLPFFSFLYCKALICFCIVMVVESEMSAFVLDMANCGQPRPQLISV